MESYRIFGDPRSNLVVLRLCGEHESEIDTELNMLRNTIGSEDWCIILVPISDWTYEMTPWFAPGAFYSQDDEIQCGGAMDKLQLILEKVLVEFEHAYFNDDRRYILAGYSLAGLFALWASYQTNKFWGIVAASPSVWYPDWIQYAKEHQCNAFEVYLSLGNKEHKTRNALMSKVDDYIQMQRECLEKKGIKVIFEMNQGNHFKDVTDRMVKGISKLIISANKRPKSM